MNSDRQNRRGALDEHVDDIIRRYDGGNGERVVDLAREYGVSPQSVRLRLTRAGVANFKRAGGYVYERTGDDWSAANVALRNHRAADALHVQKVMASGSFAVLPG